MIISDRTLKNIANELEAQNALIGAIAGKNPGSYVVESWDEVQEIVSNGIANHVFAIGEQLIAGYTYSGVEYENAWDVVGFGTAIVKDDNGNEVEKPAMFIQQHYATIEGVQYDAPEPNNTLNTDGSVNTDVATYGYNRWSESGIRAWLNSEETAGHWFGSSFERNGVIVPRRASDVAPTQHSTYNGYLFNMDKELLSVLKPIKVTTATNTVTDGGVIDYTWDKIFLPSLIEMHINPQSTVEGSDWEYYRAMQDTPFAQYGTYTALIKYALNNKTSAQHCWLRSANRGTSRLAWYVYSSGYVSNSYASYAYRCAPACAIVGI